VDTALRTFLDGLAREGPLTASGAV